MKEMTEDRTPKLLTIKEVARRMKVSRQSVYEWIKKGKITTVKTPGGRQRIIDDLLIPKQPETTEAEHKEWYRIEDISELEPGRLETTGLKEKFWFENRDSKRFWNADTEQFLFKIGRVGTGENWAEVIVCQLCELLGLPHAQYKFAQYRGKKGVITPSFVPTQTSLILGNEILQRIFTGYKIEQRYKQRIHTLTRVIAAIGKETYVPIGWQATEEINDAIGVLVGYLLLDAWIGNTDRHHENWGLIRDIGTKRFYLAPTFDHASSLGSHELDSDKQERMTTKDRNRTVQAYVTKARSALYGKQADVNPLFTIDAFTEAFSARHKAGLSWLERLEDINPGDVLRILDNVSNELMSDISKEFVERILRENKHRLLETRK